MHRGPVRLAEAGIALVYPISGRRMRQSVQEKSDEERFFALLSSVSSSECLVPRLVRDRPIPVILSVSEESLVVGLANAHAGNQTKSPGHTIQNDTWWRRSGTQTFVPAKKAHLPRR